MVSTKKPTARKASPKAKATRKPATAPKEKAYFVLDGEIRLETRRGAKVLTSEVIDGHAVLKLVLHTLEEALARADAGTVFAPTRTKRSKTHDDKGTK